MDKAQRPTFLEDPGTGELIGRDSGCVRVYFGQAGCEPKVGLAQHGGPLVPTPGRL